MKQSNAQFVCGCYTLKGKILTPEATQNQHAIKALMICDSKHEGRPKYIASLTIGDAKPQFISSIYEPRTPSGWFNFEMNGHRFEVVKNDEASACIIEYKVRTRKNQKSHV